MLLSHKMFLAINSVYLIYVSVGGLNYTTVTPVMHVLRVGQNIINIPQQTARQYNNHTIYCYDINKHNDSFVKTEFLLYMTPLHFRCVPNKVRVVQQQHTKSSHS